MTSPLYEEALRLSGLGKERWALIAQAIDATHHFGGEIWECGCWQGGTALWMRDHIGPDSSRVIRAFDTFTGLPTSGPHDTHPIGAMQADRGEAMARLSTYEVLVYPGVMPDSFRGLEDSLISVAHIDVDQYDGVKGCLEWLYPRLHSGGYLIIDDYYDGFCAGARKATDDFAAQHGLTVVNGQNPQVYIVKP